MRRPTSRPFGALCRCRRAVLTYSGPPHPSWCPRHRPLIISEQQWESEPPEKWLAALTRLGACVLVVAPWPEP